MPTKFAYFVLPILTALRLKRFQLIDPKVENDAGEFKTGLEFDPFDYFITLTFPAGV